jgi:hypothetical protein
MWVLFVGALAWAGPEFVGMELGEGPAADDEGMRVPLEAAALHVAVRHRGEVLQVRCVPEGGRCAVVDGPLAGRRFRLPAEVELTRPAQGCVAELPLGVVACGGAGSWPGVPASQLGAALVRSDLAGETSWSTPTQVDVELSDGVRWAGEALGTFGELSASARVEVSAQQADRWRCQAAEVAAGMSALILDAGAGWAWLGEAEARCATPVAAARAAFCVAVAGDPAVAGWCAEVAPAVASVTVRYDQVSLKRRVSPGYPEEAKGLGLGEVRCKSTLYLDERGSVLRVVVTGCPPVFFGPTEAALMKWAYYPPKIDGVARAVHTMVSVRYVEP